MNKINVFIIFLIIYLFTSKAFSLSSSSYLIANSAVSFFDYEEASIYFENSTINDFSENDLEKKLIVFVNTSNLLKAFDVAEELLLKDNTNQEAWLIYLIYAKLNNLKEPFKIFENLKKEENLEIIDYIFYNLDSKINNDQLISKNIFKIVNSASDENINDFQNYNYLIFYINSSLILNNEYDEANYYLGALYEKLKNYKKAEEHYARVNKNNDYLYFESQKRIATNKKFYKNLDESEKYYLKILKIYPDNIIFNIGLADLYRTSSEYLKAIKIYSKVINQNTEQDLEWQLLYYRGVCYEQLNDWELAEKDFLESLNINWESPQVLNYLAYGWIERDIFLDKSLDMLVLAHDKYPESHYILDSLAWAHFKKNNLQIASKLMEEVINRAPAEAISLDHLGDIYFALGRNREAYYMWKQAFDLAKPEDDILDSVKMKIEKFNAG